MMFPATGIIETLILLATTFKNDGNVAFGENTQNRQRIDKQCETKVDKDFTMFVATFKGNYSRIKRNIEELRNQYMRCPHSDGLCVSKNHLRGLKRDISCERSKPQEFYYCDWNLHIADALWRYMKLLHLFKGRLQNIENMKMYKSPPIASVTTVKEEWLKLWHDIKDLVKEYEECGVTEEASRNSEVKRTITDIIFPYNHAVTTCLDKRKEAASTLNQMLLVLETMDYDLDHRVGYLRRCLSMKI